MGRNEEGLVPLDTLVKIEEIPNKATATKWEATKEHKGPSIQGFISLKLGDIVVEIEPPKDGWVKVKNDRDEEGLVPLNSLSKIEGIPYKATATKWEATKEHKGPGIQGFISLKLGDIVVEIDPPKNDWVKVKNDRDEEGLVPLHSLSKIAENLSKATESKWEAIKEHEN